MRFFGAQNLFAEPTARLERQHGRGSGGSGGGTVIPAAPGQTAVTDEIGFVLTDENGNAIVIE